MESFSRRQRGRGGPGARWGRTFAITIRPHSSYTRWFRALGEGEADPRYCRLTGGRDVPGGFGVRANGAWRHAPDLTRAGEAWSDSGVAWTPEGIRDPGRPPGRSTPRTSSRAPGSRPRAPGSRSRSRATPGSHGRRPGKAQTWEGRPDTWCAPFLKGTGSRLSGLSVETVTQLNPAVAPPAGPGCQPDQAPGRAAGGGDPVRA